jgi:hypothetical protein
VEIKIKFDSLDIWPKNKIDIPIKMPEQVLMSATKVKYLKDDKQCDD